MPFFSMKTLKNSKLIFEAKFSLPTMLTALIVILATMNYAWADNTPRSASLNYSQKALSNFGNPAASAYVIDRNDPHVLSGGQIELGSGVEFGNFDELFAKYDELSFLFSPPSDGDDGSSEPSEPIPENPDRDYQWIDFLEQYPELEERLDLIKAKVVTTAALLAVISSEGYANAELTGDFSFVLSEDLFGGTLLFGSAHKGTSKAIGLLDEINFDEAQAKESLLTIPHFSEDDPIQELDLSGGITLFYNPQNKQAKMTVDNDSLLLVKGTKISEYSLSYSHLASEQDAGNLYWGVKPKLYRVGLTNVSTRIGDITDTEAFYDDIKNANYVYENGYDVDLGLVWAAEHYQLGASVSSLFEHTYEFPELDRTGYQSERILNQLSKHKTYTMERQLKLEGGVFTAQRHWSLNAEVDVNPVEDPMRDEYQWLTLTGGYASESWWLPSARLGFSRNLTGSELTYLNAGVTLMRYINIDAATTLNTVTLDGQELKRGMNIRLGVQFAY